MHRLIPKPNYASSTIAGLKTSLVHHAAPALAGEMHAGPSQLPEMPQLRLIVDQLISGPNLYKFDVRRMKAGQLLCGSGDTAQGLLVVRQGRLRCFSSFEGKELTLFTLDAGDAIPLQLGSMLEAKTDGEIVIISEKLLQGSHAAIRISRCRQCPLLAKCLKDRCKWSRTWRSDALSTGWCAHSVRPRGVMAAKAGGALFWMRHPTPKNSPCGLVPPASPYPR